VWGRWLPYKRTKNSRANSWKLRHQIMRARKVSQLQDNLASLDLELSAEQLKSLDGASGIELEFPQDTYETETQIWRHVGSLAALSAAVQAECRIVMQVPTFKLPACSRVTGYSEVTSYRGSDSAKCSGRGARGAAPPASHPTYPHPYNVSRRWNPYKHTIHYLPKYPAKERDQSCRK
jgi:hypothetical protein